MKLIVSLLMAAVPFFISGCLVSPVGTSGGMGSVTVVNSNPAAIVAAAQTVFPQAGYGLGPADFPDSISFDKGSSQIANIMWGSYGNPQTIRVRVRILPIAGTSNYRLVPKVFSVSDAGEAGFDSERPLMGLWSSEFGPLLKQVASQAGGAGGM